jgi:hypothetical protein
LGGNKIISAHPALDAGSEGILSKWLDPASGAGCAVVGILKKGKTMTNTNNLSIPLVVQSQAQKEVTINEAFYILEALQNRGVVDKDLATPPSSPAAGDAYIVAASPTGAWAGKAKNIAYYNAGWKFIAPNEGLLIWVNDENKIYAYDGTNWAELLNNLASLGVNTSADATNKLAVSSSAILFNHAGAGIQAKINKNSAGDTASYLFQTGFSGRAEFGNIGSDDFTLKVSADGSSWNDALVVDKSSGDVGVQKVLKIKEGTNQAMGVATLVAGAVTVSTNKVTANSRIFLTAQNNSGTAGHLYIGTKTAGTSFVINSTSGTDTRQVAWVIVNPA